MSIVFSEVGKELERLRERTARFRRVALHIHSPDSHDWGRGNCDTERNDRDRLRTEAGVAEYLRELQPYVDLAGVTDHMRCGYATRVSALARGTAGIVVLPGMEVNFRPEAALGYARIHLLVLFSEGASPESFERLFVGHSNVPSDDTKRTGQEEITGITLREWVERVHQEGGLCIGAHVDNAQGVRCVFRQTSRSTLRLFCNQQGADIERENDVPESLRRYLLESQLDAVEISRGADAPHYSWVSELDGRKVSIATLLKFDAHCVEQFARKEQVTFVKMTRPGLQGLKDGFAFPDTRIRFQDNLPSPPSPVLLGIQINGDADAFFGDVTIALTENLNCIIGARGSGKSTLVETLRYVFGYNRSLGELDKLQKSIRDMQMNNLRGCLIRVFYRTSAGDVRVLEATYDEKSDYATKVYTDAGDFLEVADVEASGEYPLRLFGWSEIETLGRSPARQRDMLDRLVPEVTPVIRKRAELRNRLRANRGAVQKTIEELRAALNTSDGEIRRYKEYKEDFEKLNTPEVKTLFSALDLAEGKCRILEQVRTNARLLIDRLGDPDSLSLHTDVDSMLEQGDGSLQEWWLAHEMERLRILSTERDVQGAVREATSRIEMFAQLVGEHIKEAGEEIDAVQAKLRDQFASDGSKQKLADLRANAEKRLRHVSALRKEYLETWKTLKMVLDERKAIADEIVAVQHQIAGIRARHNRTVEDRLNRFLPAEMKVSIQFASGADTVLFAQRVTPLLAGAKRYKARRLNQVVADHYSPVEFARMLGNGEFDDLVGKSGGSGDGFASADTAGIREKTYPFQPDEYADVTVLSDDGKRLDAILDLQEVEWDDFAAILLNGGPVNEKSPGQRSSAMLPLIALAEKTPLVIDQPEDNLDKRLIGNVLVRILADLKEQRQMIVCTHDPNILVGGDAEQVVVLDAVSDRRGKVILHGSIDNEDVVQTVVDLLEGGAAAFAARRKRYGRQVDLAD